MIVKRMWIQRSYVGHEWHCEGWYLFGLLPLYIRDMQPRGSK